MNGAKSGIFEFLTCLSKELMRRVFFSANIATIMLLTDEALTVFTSSQKIVLNVKFFILSIFNMKLVNFSC